MEDRIGVLISPENCDGAQVLCGFESYIFRQISSYSIAVNAPGCQPEDHGFDPRCERQVLIQIERPAC
jgi:hypothetical protein